MTTPETDSQHKFVILGTEPGGPFCEADDIGGARLAAKTMIEEDGVVFVGIFQRGREFPVQTAVRSSLTGQVEYRS